MKVIVSAATSLDGYMDDTSPVRLRLSSDEDWRQVAMLRSRCDAILVGAGTIRKDNPSLVIKDEALRRERVQRGLKPDIDKVTISEDLGLDPSAEFFTAGAGRKIVFVPAAAPEGNSAALAAIPGVEIVRLEKVTARAVVAWLAEYGYEQLMVEGGAIILRMFFGEGVVDELRHAVAPVTIGQSAAPHFELPANLVLQDKYMAGDTTVYNYIVLRSDIDYLLEAIEQSRLSPPSQTAFRVGAVIVTSGGKIYKGYTHQSGPHNHAEEEAIGQALAAGEALAGAVIYTSMEPCSKRTSKPVSCTEHIIRNRFARVIFALTEPSTFVHNTSREMLRRAGIEVTEIDSLAPLVREVNSHLLK